MARTALKENIIYPIIERLLFEKGVGRGASSSITRATNEIVAELLPKGQKRVYDAVTDSYQNTHDIAKSLGLTSKAVSATLLAISNKTLLLDTRKVGDTLLWKRS